MTSGRRTILERDGRWRLAVWGAAAGLLLIPAVAMQISAEVAWGPEDFAAFAAILFAACAAFEVVAWLTPSRLHRLCAGGMIVVLSLVVWAQLAVGVF